MLDVLIKYTLLVTIIPSLKAHYLTWIIKILLNGIRDVLVNLKVLIAKVN